MWKTLQDVIVAVLSSIWGSHLPFIIIKDVSTEKEADSRSALICRDETLKCSELTVKLESAFLAGLRCVQPPIRAKFFEVFNTSMKARLHDRLMYITCSQNWEAMGPHYWIKQCIELLLVTASPSK